VRGLASILANGLNETTPEEIISVPGDFYLPMNLQEAISQQRLTGFVGVLGHMKQEAVKLLEKKSG
jgi:cysteine desulfuration protein SufE